MITALKPGDVRVVFPGVCTNKKCGTFFLAPSGIIIGTKGGSIVAKKEIKLLKACPKCGSDGKGFPGTYTAVDGKTHFTPAEGADIATLKRAMTIIREAIRGQITPQDFRRVAEERAPGLSPLWDLAPRTRAEAYTFWQTVLMTLTFLLGLYGVITPPQGQPSQVVLPKEIHDLIRAHLDTPADTHTTSPRQAVKPKHRRKR